MSGPLALVDRAYDESRYANAFNEITVSRNRVFGASFHEAYLDNPEPSLYRLNELDQAQGTNPGMRGALTFGFGPIYRGDEDHSRISEEEFNASYAQMGLAWSKDMTRETAAVLGRRKQRELQNRDMTSRGPDGFLTGAGIFGSALVAAALSPTNVAVSFIPIVGQGRWAAWVAKYGTTRAAMARGAIEGAVGNILIEPATYAARTQEQADFTAMDSLFNVVVGTVLGSGLHVGAEHIKLKLKGIREGRAEATAALDADMRTVDVVANQLLNDQPVDVRALDIAHRADIAEARVETRAQRVRASTTLDLDEIAQGRVPKHTVVESAGKGKGKFEVVFPDEEGDFKGLRGRGRTEQAAVADLLTNYEVLYRFDNPVGTPDHVAVMQRELDELVDQRNEMRARLQDPDTVRSLLQEKGVPVASLDELRTRIAKRQEERGNIRGKKLSKKLREYDAETERLQSEFRDMKQATLGGSQYVDVLSTIQQDIKRVEGRVTQLRKAIHREAQQMAMETSSRQVQPARVTQEATQDVVQVPKKNQTELEAIDEYIVDAEDVATKLSDNEESLASTKQAIEESNKLIADAEKKGNLLSRIVNCIRNEA